MHCVQYANTISICHNMHFSDEVQVARPGQHGETWKLEGHGGAGTTVAKLYSGWLLGPGALAPGVPRRRVTVEHPRARPRRPGGATVTLH